MKTNRSLELSLKINQHIKEGLLGPLNQYISEEIVERHAKEEPVKRRDRLYSISNTVQTMIAAATHEDKSLQNAVMVFQGILKSGTDVLIKEEVVKEKWHEAQPKKSGRPRKRKLVGVAKSKLQDISLSTSSYATARQRVPLGLMKELFDKSKATASSEEEYRWHGYPVYLTDGTYLQLQDSPELRKKYSCSLTKAETNYPQALLAGVIRQGSGCIHGYRLAPRSVSELDLVSDLILEIPRNSLLLADDLYNCYAVFCMAKSQEIDMVVPAKRIRKYRLEKVLAHGDEIISIPATAAAIARLSLQRPNESIPKTLSVRRITYTNPTNPEKTYTLITTILNESIDKADIVALYASRWDIEVSIREMKTIMHLNVLRAKTDDMIHKELAASLIAYNLVRKLISSAVDSTDFSPKKDLFFEFYSFGKEILVDKCGRIYSRRSPGRLGFSDGFNKKMSHTA